MIPARDEWLVDFLTARLDEDAEAVEAASTEVGSTGEWVATLDRRRAPSVTTVSLGRDVLVASPLGTQDAAFIARFDPARARREVEYGRWLLAGHAEQRSVRSLRGLQRYALRFDAHPDWDESWRPA